MKFRILKREIGDMVQYTPQVKKHWWNGWDYIAHNYEYPRGFGFYIVWFNTYDEAIQKLEDFKNYKPEKITAIDL